MKNIWKSIHCNKAGLFYVGKSDVDEKSGYVKTIWRHSVFKQLFCNCGSYRYLKRPIHSFVQIDRCTKGQSKYLIGHVKGLF